MATKSKRRKKLAEEKAKRRARMHNPKGSSRYARKAKWLHANGGEWGFNVPEPKPWK